MFEREARELTFSRFHQNDNCITSIVCITHLYQKKITRTRDAQMHTQMLHLTRASRSNAGTEKEKSTKSYGYWKQRQRGDRQER